MFLFANADPLGWLIILSLLAFAIVLLIALGDKGAQNTIQQRRPTELVIEPVVTEEDLEPEPPLEEEPELEEPPPPVESIDVEVVVPGNGVYTGEIERNAPEETPVEEAVEIPVEEAPMEPEPEKVIPEPPLPMPDPPPTESVKSEGSSEAGESDFDDSNDF